MKRLMVTCLVAVLAVAGLAAVAGPAGFDPLSPQGAPQPTAPGMVVAIDPVTGELREPTPADFAAAAQNSTFDFNTSDEGLTEERNLGPGGGYTVNLQGRFQNSMAVTIDAAGVTHTTCGSPAQAASPRPGGVK